MTHPYCAHDEGEDCSCAVELSTQRVDERTNRPRRADRRAAQLAALQAANPNLTRRELAQQLGTTLRTVERLRARLKQGAT